MVFGPAFFGQGRSVQLPEIWSVKKEVGSTMALAVESLRAQNSVRLEHRDIELLDKEIEEDAA